MSEISIDLLVMLSVGVHILETPFMDSLGTPLRLLHLKACLVGFGPQLTSCFLYGPVPTLFHQPVIPWGMAYFAIGYNGFLVNPCDDAADSRTQ